MDFLTDLLSQEAKIQLQNLIDDRITNRHDHIRKVLNIDSYLTNDDENHSEMMYLMDRSQSFQTTVSTSLCDIITRRIFVDKYVKFILDDLYMITENIIPKSYLIDMILCRWIVNISESILNLRVNLPIPDMSDKLPYITIDVSEDIWKRFLKTCDNCEHILVKDAFKQAIFYYIEDVSNRQLMMRDKQSTTPA